MGDAAWSIETAPWLDRLDLPVILSSGKVESSSEPSTTIAPSSALAGLGIFNRQVYGTRLSRDS